MQHAMLHVVSNTDVYNTQQNGNSMVAGGWWLTGKSNKNLWFQFQSNRTNISWRSVFYSSLLFCECVCTCKKEKLKNSMNILLSSHNSCKLMNKSNSLKAMVSMCKRKNETRTEIQVNLNAKWMYVVRPPRGGPKN